MNKKIKVAAALSIFVLGASVGRQGELLVRGYISDQERRISCSWLDHRLLTDKNSISQKTAKQFAQVLTFIESECWSGKR